MTPISKETMSNIRKEIKSLGINASIRKTGDLVRLRESVSIVPAKRMWTFAEAEQVREILVRYNVVNQYAESCTTPVFCHQGFWYMYQG